MTLLPKPNDMVVNITQWVPYNIAPKQGSNLCGDMRATHSVLIKFTSMGKYLNWLVIIRFCDRPHPQKFRPCPQGVTHYYPYLLSVVYTVHLSQTIPHCGISNVLSRAQFLLSIRLLM